MLGHTVLDGGLLAVAAHAAGFPYVARSGATAVVAAPPGDPVGVIGPLELEVDETVTLTVDPHPRGRLPDHPARLVQRPAGADRARTGRASS